MTDSSSNTQPSLTNYCYTDIALGQSVTVERCVNADDIALFAAISGDLNPVHLDPEYAATTPFGKPIAHGMFCGALISATIAMHFPGPGSVYRSQSIKFSKPVFIGDTLSIEVVVTEKQDRLKLLTLACTVTNQQGKTVASGEAGVIAPAEKVTIATAQLPSVTLDSRPYQRGV